MEPTPFQIEYARQLEKYDHALAAAKKLPWADFITGLAYVAGFFGAAFGFVISGWGALIGWPIGYVLGYALAILCKIPIYLWPEPFADLARRFDYVR